MHLDLTDEEAAALAHHLRDALDYARYPFASRLDPLKASIINGNPPEPDRSQKGNNSRHESKASG
jgi:hypothetical protein